MSQLQRHQPTAGEGAQQQPATGRFQPTAGGAAGGGVMGRFFPTRNYLSEGTRRASIALLNQALVDTTVLSTHAKAAHWNVKGPNFFALHELFEEIYEDLEEHADEIAERVTALGGEARGTVHVAAAHSRIPDLPEGAITGEEWIQLLAERLSLHDAHLGEGIRLASQQDDPDTADLLNEVSREVTKDLWFLEAHLQTQPITPAGGQQQPQSTGGMGHGAGGGVAGSGVGGGQQSGYGQPQFGGQPQAQSSVGPGQSGQQATSQQQW